MKKKHSSKNKKLNFSPAFNQPASSRPILPKEIQGLLLLLLTVALTLSLISFTDGNETTNYLGLFGYSTAFVLQYSFGVGSYLVLAFLFALSWSLIGQKNFNDFKRKALYFTVFLFCSCMLFNIGVESYPQLGSYFRPYIFSEYAQLTTPQTYQKVRDNLGGVPLYYLYKDLPKANLERLLGQVGSTLIFSSVLVTSLLLICNVSLHDMIAQFSAYLARREEKRESKERFRFLRHLKWPSFLKSSKKELPIDLLQDAPNKTEFISTSFNEMEDPIASYPTHPQAKQENKQKLPPSKRETALKEQQVYNGDFSQYEFPNTVFLKDAQQQDSSLLKKTLMGQAAILEKTLLSFGIEAKVGKIHCGPTITSFEVHPPVGVKVQKIKALENDIALNMKAKSLRIIAPIPGKAAVGIEVPNPYPQEVSFKQMLQSYQKKQKKFRIPILLGKTVHGEHVEADLTKMPHCIIAGTTGSGKSVCINSIIVSILMNAKPNEIKLLLVDPKKVELTPYNELPHMVAPVITEPQGAYMALNWLVKEMEKRYEILKLVGARNIQAYNQRKIDKEFEATLPNKVPSKMYYMVAIIDELADLMMISNCDIETPIARIAQMARAVGIHLILATQRPSREVITGIIKANFPTRIAFKVASRINSQIILDETGAESLLGNGDLLFLPPGTSHTIRAQGAFIRDEDIQTVVNSICKQAPPNYLIPSFDKMQEHFLKETESKEKKDSLFNEAKSIVISTQNASTTFLQRKLKIGYARAASLIDQLEDHGIIGPHENGRGRQVMKKPPS